MAQFWMRFALITMMNLIFGVNKKSAEREGFEPSVATRATTVFETVPIVHSGTSPACRHPLYSKEQNELTTATVRNWSAVQENVRGAGRHRPVTSPSAHWLPQFHHAQG